MADHYLIFPIALMQFDLGGDRGNRKSLDDVTAAEAKERVEGIINYCVCDMMMKIHEELVLLAAGEPDRLKYLDMAHRQSEQLGVACDDGDDEQVAYLAAQAMLGWLCRNTLNAGRKTVRKLQGSVASDLGKKLTRIRNDVLVDVMTGKMPWRDFAVLAAVYAGCFSGNGKASTLTMCQLGAMASGFGSSRQGAGVAVLHTKAIGRTVERLRKRGLFAKASPDNGRHTYYSNRLSQDELTKYVASIRARKLGRTNVTCSEIQRRVNELSCQSIDSG